MTKKTLVLILVLIRLSSPPLVGSLYVGVIAAGPFPDLLLYCVKHFCRHYYTRFIVIILSWWQSISLLDLICNCFADVIVSQRFLFPWRQSLKIVLDFVALCMFIDILICCAWCNWTLAILTSIVIERTDLFLLSYVHAVWIFLIYSSTACQVKWSSLLRNGAV